MNNKIITDSVRISQGTNMLDLISAMPKGVKYTDLTVDIESWVDNYGNAEAELHFQFKRLETDAETLARENLERAREEREKEREFNLYRNLKAKYESVEVINKE